VLAYTIGLSDFPAVMPTSVIFADLFVSRLQVPVLKLKVGAGGYVEGSAVVDDDVDTLNTTTQSNDCSSDFENQSISTMHSRLSSSSELDDQASTEVNGLVDSWSGLADMK